MSFAATGAWAARATASSTVSIAPLQIQVGSNRGLGFGTILPAGGEAVVTVSPTGARTTSGVSSPSGAGVSSARFTATGSASRTVAVTLPATVDLTSTAQGATVLTVSQFTLDGQGVGTLTYIGGQNFSGTFSPSGNLVFVVGGTLRFAGAPPSGGYSGSVPVSVDYN